MTSHPQYEEKFRVLAGLSKDTVIGQTDKGEFYFGIVDQAQRVIMFDKFEAVLHQSHDKEETL